MPKLSFVMPSRRIGEPFDRAVAAILDQTEKDIELIICNTNPAKEHGDWPDDKRVKVIHDFSAPDTWQGAIHAENMGYRQAQGEYICSAGDDDFLMREYAEVFINAFRQRPWADLVYSNYIALEEKHNSLSPQYIGPFNRNKLKYKGNYMAYATIVMKNTGDIQYDETYRTISDYKHYLSWSEAGKSFEFITVPLAFIRNRGKTAGFIEEKLAEILRLREEFGDPLIAQEKYSSWLTKFRPAGKTAEEMDAEAHKLFKEYKMVNHVFDLNRKEKPAEYYDEEPPVEKYIELYKKALGLLPPARDYKILDIGCGSGRFAEILFEDGYRHYAGVDFSKKRIEKAKQITGQDCFFLSDVTKSQNSWFDGYDVYVLLEFLEHIKEDIEVVKRIPSGCRVIFSVPNFMSDDHVRCFGTPEVVQNRYAEFLDCKEYRIIPTTEWRRIFLFDAVRK